MTDKTKNRSAKFALRCLVYAVGVCLVAFGVVVNTRGGLGASTVNCIAFVFDETTFLTLGQATMCIYVVDLIIQIVVFKGMSARIALQIPFSFLFGFLVDLFDGLIANGALWFFQSPDVAMGAFMLILGIFCTGVGVSMMINMNFVPNPPDGCTQAVSKLTELPFGRAKWLNDAGRLMLAIILGLAMSGQVLGVGIGTVVCVFTIGNVCQFVDDHAGSFYRRVYDPAQAKPHKACRRRTHRATA